MITEYFLFDNDIADRKTVTLELTRMIVIKIII